MRTRRWFRVALAPAVAFVLLSGGVTVARSQVDDFSVTSENPGSPPGGLYRDMDGGYWCGGTCGANQQCCRIILEM